MNSNETNLEPYMERIRASQNPDFNEKSKDMMIKAVMKYPELAERIARKAEGF